MTTTPDERNKAAFPEDDSSSSSDGLLKRQKKKLKGRGRDRSREPAAGPVLPGASENNSREIGTEPATGQTGSGSGGAQEVPPTPVTEPESANAISIELWDEAYQELKDSFENGDLVEGYERVLSYEIQRLGLEGNNKTRRFYSVSASHLQQRIRL
jgi:hypothetical protein